MGQIKKPDPTPYEEPCVIDRIVADGVHAVQVFGGNIVWTLYRKRFCREMKIVCHVGILEIQLPLETVERNIRMTRDAAALERERAMISIKLDS